MATYPGEAYAHVRQANFYGDVDNVGDELMLQALDGNAQWAARNAVKLNVFMESSKTEVNTCQSTVIVAGV